MSKDLGFSDEDRAENSRRVAEVSKLLAESDFVVIASLISPLRLDRKIARSILKGTFFVETFIDAPIEVCERRDPKKLYAKARRGEIQQFTGIDSRFEAPSEPELQINTTNLTIEQSVNMILEYMENEIFDRKSNAINRSLGWCWRLLLANTAQLCDGRSNWLSIGEKQRTPVVKVLLFTEHVRYL